MLKPKNIDFSKEHYGILVERKDSVEFCEMGRLFYIKLIERNYENGTIYLTFKSNYGNEKITHTMSRDKLDIAGMKELAKNGFDVKNLEVFQILVPILEEIYLEKNKVCSIHEGVGWDVIENDYQKEFGDKEGYVYKTYNRIGNVESRYAGLFDIEPRGTLEGQLEFIKKEVQGNVACEVAVALGLSAVVNGRIRDIVHTPNLIVHMYGDSSRGKTTAAQLAVSVAGIPDMQKTSLMMSWNATTNASISRLKENRGMPVVMDEFSKISVKDVTNLIYSLSDGRDKERLKKDASLRNVSKHDSFATTIISTGEATITGKCKNNTGIKTRVIEIDTQFTNSANHADNIKKACFENCGHLAPELAYFMQEKGIDYVVERHTYWKEKYMEKTKVSTLKERVSANYAVILLAAEMANEVFEFSFNLDGILEFFIENEKENSQERDIAVEVSEKLINFALSNRGHFVRYTHENGMKTVDNISNETLEIYGRIDEGKNRTHKNGKTSINEYSFTVDAFKKIISKLGYEDDKVLLKKLKQADLLDCEDGKRYRRRKLFQRDNTTTKMYVICEYEEELVFDDTFEVVNDDSPNPFEQERITP